MINLKKLIGTLSGCIACFSALYFVGLQTYLKKIIKLDKIKYDLQTVTASDYTLEIMLTH
jgi:hypothetical protein